MPAIDLSSAAWRKSTLSDAKESCVEVAPLPDMIAVRDTKDRDGGMLVIERDRWATFVGSLPEQASIALLGRLRDEA